jgi:hypothetical protein
MNDKKQIEMTEQFRQELKSARTEVEFNMVATKYDPTLAFLMVLTVDAAGRKDDAAKRKYLKQAKARKRELRALMNDIKLV